MRTLRAKRAWLIAAMALLAAAPATRAQTPPLLREAPSREVGLFVGGDPTPPFKAAQSREVSVFTAGDPASHYPQGVSREVALVTATTAPPAPIRNGFATASPTGSSATLNWSGYNELAQYDVVRYLVYVSTTPFTSVTGLTPYTSVPAGAQTLTISNLAEWQDHYFVVVPVDILGGSNSTVYYFADYVVAPQAQSREFALFVGGDPPSRYGEGVSRELTVVDSAAGPPAEITQLAISNSPTGAAATLDWSAYNEQAQGDIARYAVYVSSAPITSVSGLTPYSYVAGGTQSITISNLAEFQDHFFAVVAVDALGRFITTVKYAAAYIVAAQEASREVALFVGGTPAGGDLEGLSREVSVVVPDSTPPAPVTGVGGGFTANASIAAFSAIDLDWSGYDEAAQLDVVGYRIYVGSSFFTDVTGMAPYQYAPAARSHWTVTGLFGGSIYYVAVVAQDAAGQFNPSVRAVSAQASLSSLGDASGLAVVSYSNALHFSWTPPGQVDAFLSHYNVYFNGATNPISVAPSATSYDATNLLPATGYSFRVTTVDTFGTESGGISLQAATWLGNPSPVGALSFDGMVRLTWAQVEPNNLVQTYQIFEAASPFTSVASMTPVLSTRGNRADVPGLANGATYYFAVVTENIVGGENQTVQTVAASPNPIVGNFADLQITNVTGPVIAYAGQAVSINWSVTNVGAAATSLSNGTPVAAWTDRVALSADGVYGDADDILLTNVAHAGVLAAGQGYAAALALNLPTNLTGAFHLFVQANGNGAVYEGLDLAPDLGVAASLVSIGPPSAPFITNQPAPQAVPSGTNVTFAVSAGGTPPLSYQWRLRGTNLTDAVRVTGSLSNLLSLSSVTTNDSGSYSVVVSNPYGAITSSPAPLSVTAPPPPMPDLTVGQVSSPLTGTPGAAITVSWAVTNVGATNAVGPWEEAVYLAPASVTLPQFNANAAAYPLLGVFTYSNSLGAGSNILRSQQVTLPVTGPAGDARIVAVADAGNQVAEQNELNNAAFALNDIQIPAALAFSLPVTNVLESAAAPNLPCLVLRNGDLSAPVTVTLASAATNHLLLPANVTIPAGSAAAPFYATVVDDGLPDADALVTLSANAGGYLGATSQVTVVNTDLPGLTLSFDSGQITQGEVMNGKVTAQITAAHPVQVALGGAANGILSVPSSVTIPANTNAVTFPISALQNTVVSPPQPVTLIASADNYGRGQATLTVLNTNNPVIALSLDRTNINESDGALAVIGTVARQPVTDRPLTIFLTSSNTGAALAPATVTIGSFEASAQFHVSAVNDTNVTGPKSSLISAQALDVYGGSAGAPAGELLFVQDNNGPSLRVGIADKVVAKGADPATTATVWTYSAPASNLLVTLVSSDTNEIAVPATVTIPAGQTNVMFSVSSLDDGDATSNAVVSINASAANYAGDSDALTVTSVLEPDLVISEIDAPSAAFSGESLTLSFTLMNEGLGALTNSVAQYVYLTTDPVLGTLNLIGTANFSGSLGPGQSAEQTIVVPGAALPPPGEYWLMVTADAQDAAAELNKANNSAFAPSQVALAPAYSATVVAGLTNVVAGTPVPLSGSATLTVGGPATKVPVNLLITVRGLQRTITVTTDASGNFSTFFTPLPGEGGIYTVSAVLPGITSAPAQARFNIYGMAANPVSATVNLVAGGSNGLTVVINNVGDAPLTNVTASVSGLAANLTATAQVSPGSIGGQGAANLACGVAAADASVAHSSFTIHLASSSGAALDIPVSVNVAPLTPNLVCVPGQLAASMIIGGQKLALFTIVNTGGAETGPLTVNVPAVPWLSVASTNPVPSIAPGQSNVVSLLLSPATNLALGPYNGTIVVNGNGASCQFPFTFNAVSDAHGSLLIQTVDEITFYGSNSPPLTNASISLTDPFSGQVVASGATDTNGLYLAGALPEGVYQLDIAADKHSGYHGSAVVTAGQTNTLQALLSLQTVQYVWTVTPTQVQDKTQITIQAVFDANVPAPVIVPSPAYLDLSTLTQPGQSIDTQITLANYGLIAVQNVTIGFGSSDFYQVEVLTPNLGTLPAHGSVTVPVRISRVSPGGGARKLSSPGCYPAMNFTWAWPCGNHQITASTPFNLLNGQQDCPGAGGGAVGGSVAVTGGGAVSVSYVPPRISPLTVCDCSFLPKICLSGSSSLKLDGLAEKLAASLTKFLPNFSIKKVEVKLSAGGKICTCCLSNQLDWEGDVTGSASVTIVLTAGPSFAADLPFSAAGFDSVSAKVDALAGAEVTLSGNVTAQLVKKCLQDPDVCLSGTATLSLFAGLKASAEVTAKAGGVTYTGKIDGKLGLEGSATATVQGCLNSGVKASLSGKVTATAQFTGELSGSSGGATVSKSIDAGGSEVVAEAGVGNAVRGGPVKLDNPPSIDVDILPEDVLQPDSAIRSALGISSGPTVGVCAQVTLQISQSAVLTLDAFNAMLQLNNSSGDVLTNVGVSLVIQNQLGQDVTGLFAVLPPAITGGLTAVDGTGIIPSSASGSAQWTLIPTVDAAPDAPTNYLVSGSFTYVDRGEVVTVPLAPTAISVQPAPQLYLKYFLQHDVYGDDPYTGPIEPSIPFPLAVMAQNKGRGAAHNFQITSAQPTIVDNKKGLLINFNIIGAALNGQPADPSLTVDFGDIAAGQIGIGTWLMTSSLDGQFINYQATFQHVDPLGNLQLGGIEGVEIHQLAHMARAEGAWDDGLPDFLATDTPNVNNFPDTIYLSDGSTYPVSVLQAASPDAAAAANHLQVQLTGNYPAGFCYVVIPDPGAGNFPLQSMLHNDGSPFLTNNYYITDRTFAGVGQRPLLQTNLHFLVYHTNAGPDACTLVYSAPTNAPDTTPPISSVFSLPLESPPVFGVVWSGADIAGGSGLANYDIYASDNGGAFTIWQSHTTAVGALYNGTAGHTYGFYSQATDNAGNREAAPAHAQAQTTVAVNTIPPSLGVASPVTLTAGQTLSLDVTASPANPLFLLSFSLLPGAPAGLTVDPNSGHIGWATSPLFGGTTNHFGIVATDNGQPSLSATSMVTVIVLPVNNPPTLAPIANYHIVDGYLLTVSNSASDDNLPPRPLTFSLGAGAPANAAIDPATGVFQWRPTVAQAPSTNVLSVVVSDNMTPPLRATQTFTVFVRSASSELLLSFGWTNLAAGASNAVAVTLDSQLPLTNVTANFQAAPQFLTNLALIPSSPEIVGTFLQATGAGQYSLSLALNPALAGANPRALARLGFAAVAQPHSGIVPLTVTQTAGLETDGTSAPKAASSDGRIIVVGAEPVLDPVRGAKSAVAITLYGKPGGSYQLGYKTNLANSKWIPFLRIPMTNQIQVLDLFPSGPRLFYNAWQFFADPPLMDFASVSHSNATLVLYGRSGTNYGLQSAPSLSGPWTPVTNLVLSNSFYFINVGSPTNKVQYFRSFR